MTDTTITPALAALIKTQIDELLSTAEAAVYLNLQPQTLNNWRVTKRYCLPYVRVGRLIRYRRSDLDAFITGRTIGADQN